MSGTVLVIEDEVDLATTLEYNLRSNGLTARLAHTAKAGLEAAASDPLPDVIVLDLMLPDLSGTEVCRRLRDNPHTRAIPIIMCTAKGDEIDRVVGFEVGADDYVVKPFDGQVLAARLRAVLRRGAAPSADGIRVGDLLIDRPGMSISRGDEPISLSSTEFRLLEAFLDHPSRVLSRGQLLDLVWGDPDWGDPHVVEVNVQRLRSKIGAEHIVTVRGAGYKWVSG